MVAIKATTRDSQPNLLYSIEAIEEVEGPSAAMWVESTIEADAIDPKSIRSAEGILNMARMVDDLNADTTREMRDALMPSGAKAKGLIGGQHWKEPGAFVSSTLTNAMVGKGRGGTDDLRSLCDAHGT